MYVLCYKADKHLRAAEEHHDNSLTLTKNQ